MDTTLFVTAFLDIHAEGASLKSPAVRMKHFQTLVDTGIQLVVFVSEKYRNDIVDICKRCKNVRIHRTLELEDTWTYTQCLPHKERMPAIRNAEKDTFEFLTLINAKVEFLEEVVAFYRYPQFAWIDFNLWHVIRDSEAATRTLQRLAVTPLPVTPHPVMPLPADRVYTPGCWETSVVPYGSLGKQIAWRFCGGFFIGTAAAIGDFTELYRRMLSGILGENGMMWEVNVWARMESAGWKPIWYAADHNDTILNVPF